MQQFKAQAHMPANAPASGPASAQIRAKKRRDAIQQIVVTAAQMQAIESRLFDAGIPVAALMEKVAGRITQAICELYPLSSVSQTIRVGVLVGPGHNGGDGLVVARELAFRGYEVQCYLPLFQGKAPKCKELTATHHQYAQSLGIPFMSDYAAFANCDVLIDGLFGFGLNRPLTGAIAHLVDAINALSNRQNIPVISIDLPSGLHTDTGAPLGTAIHATHTLCLGLWKQAFLQDAALPYVGHSLLIDFDIPWSDVEAILGPNPSITRITPSSALAALPLPRSPITHKYREGHVLLICGSQTYMGAAILTGLAARSSGVGLLSMAVPASLKSVITARIPDAIVVGCPETPSGAIAQFPPHLSLDRYDAIACGPGLTTSASVLVEQALNFNGPLLLDADGLNVIAHFSVGDPTAGIEALASRSSLTVLTPHEGEFKRLFPSLAGSLSDRITSVQQAAITSGAMIVLKGGRVAIAHPQGQVWLNPESTPALARGGSGDVLTGLLGGLLAQGVARSLDLGDLVATGVWWHAQAGNDAAQQKTELGVDAETLTHHLIPALRHHC